MCHGFPMWFDTRLRPGAAGRPRGRSNPGMPACPCDHSAGRQEPSQCHTATVLSVALSHCDGQDRPGAAGGRAPEGRGRTRKDAEGRGRRRTEADGGGRSRTGIPADADAPGAARRTLRLAWHASGAARIHRVSRIHRVNGARCAGCWCCRYWREQSRCGRAGTGEGSKPDRRLKEPDAGPARKRFGGVTAGTAVTASPAGFAPRRPEPRRRVPARIRARIRDRIRDRGAAGTLRDRDRRGGTVSFPAAVTPAC